VILLAALKQELNCTYDRLATLANEMKNLRLLMGHDTEDKRQYTGQPLHDNISLMSATLLQNLNQLIVEVAIKWSVTRLAICSSVLQTARYRSPMLSILPTCGYSGHQPHV